ncbi:DUF4184 family protein [Streptomyces erythrochromogenes]|uniref:DUF4184 family protein n=1 Tax=Streptomyces erythrochromogenes TaxID=285574 RepID=UPI003866AFC1|nr:DUF4184 family protein [Streptomyces erythrochromogenes]
MPFTLSHAAAVIPAIRRTGRARGPLVASAMVLGSFAPDTFYFTDAVVEGFMAYGSITHSLLGVFTLDALLTAVLVGCWLLLREPLVALLPGRWQGRVHAFLRGEEWRARRRLPALAGWFYVSAVAGSLTHVLWDSVTHGDRWGTNALPWLGEPVAFGFPPYTFLQYGSSAIAACALLWFAATALRRLPAGAPPASVPVLGRAERWGALALIAAGVAVGVTFRVIRFFTFFDRIRTPLDIIPTVCFGAGGGLCVSLLLYGVLVRLRRRQGRGRDRHREGRADEETRTPVPTA